MRGNTALRLKLTPRVRGGHSRIGLHRTNVGQARSTLNWGLPWENTSFFALKGTCGWPGVQRSIREATGASREGPAIANDCSRHTRWCSSLARRDCKVESAALSTLVLTERGCIHSCGLPSNFGVSKTRFENLFALRYILYKRTVFL